MIDYGSKSDFEINMAVALLVLDYEDIAPVPIRGTPILQWGDGSNWHQFDPCNNPSCAWPIIVANNIDIIQDNGQECALATNSAIQAFQGDEIHLYQDENPLRAAMIVFLMMKDSQP